MTRILREPSLDKQDDAFEVMRVVTDTSITPTSRLVLIYGLTQPLGRVIGLEPLCQGLGLHRATVVKALTELEEHGYAMRRVWREGQRNRSDVTFIHPESLSGDTSCPTDPVVQSLNDRSCSTDPVGQSLSDREPTVYIRKERSSSTSQVLEEELTNQLKDSSPLKSTERATPTQSSLAILDDEDVVAVADVPAAKRSKPRTKKPKPTGDADFDRFYAVYPKHVAPGDARKALTAALKKTDLDAIVTGAERYAVQVAREGRDQRHIKYPAAWLRAECWLDEFNNTPAKRTNGHVPFHQPPPGTNTYSGWTKKITQSPGGTS